MARFAVEINDAQRNRAGRRELDRVGKQVQHDLPRAHRIDRHAQRGGHASSNSGLRSFSLTRQRIMSALRYAHARPGVGLNASVTFRDSRREYSRTSSSNVSSDSEATAAFVVANRQDHGHAGMPDRVRRHVDLPRHEIVVRICRCYVVDILEAQSADLRNSNGRQCVSAQVRTPGCAAIDAFASGVNRARVMTCIRRCSGGGRNTRSEVVITKGLLRRRNAVQTGATTSTVPFDDASACVGDSLRVAPAPATYAVQMVETGRAGRFPCCRCRGCRIGLHGVRHDCSHLGCLAGGVKNYPESR
uniref:hypothetical protein n=1 Tax=Burkholderia diffusa TaxID=488732 RepID=UPI0025B663C5|nr:hypothetical protein [Burkholderia diffusa]